MLSDDCSLTALWSVSEDPVNVDTGLPLLDMGFMLVSEDTSSVKDLELLLLSLDNSNPSLVYNVSELQLLWFDNEPRGFTVPPSSSTNIHIFQFDKNSLEQTL